MAMKLHELVPRSETCRALLDAGFPQDGCALEWVQAAGATVVTTAPRPPGLRGFAAPTLAELLAALPAVYCADVRLWLTLEKDVDDTYRLSYQKNGGASDTWPEDVTWHSNAAERAALLYLALSASGLAPAPAAPAHAEPS